MVVGDDNSLRPYLSEQIEKVACTTLSERDGIEWCIYLYL